jgi:hypothetical protein
VTQNVNDVLRDTQGAPNADSNTSVKCPGDTGEQRNEKEEPQWQINLGAHTFNGSGSIKRVIVGTNNIKVTGKMRDAEYGLCESSEKNSPPIKKIKYFHFDREQSSNNAQLDVCWDLDKNISEEKGVENENSLLNEKRRIVNQYLNQCFKPTELIQLETGERIVDSCATNFSSNNSVNNNVYSKPLKLIKTGTKYL